MINHYGGDFQYGCLYNPTSGINGYLTTCKCLTGPRNKLQQKQTFHSGFLVANWFIDGTIY